MADYRSFKPPEDGILPSEFKINEQKQASCYALWRMPKWPNKLTKPHIWAIFEWEASNSVSKFDAQDRARTVAGMLNGLRTPADLIDYKDL